MVDGPLPLVLKRKGYGRTTMPLRYIAWLEWDLLLPVSVHRIYWGYCLLEMRIGYTHGKTWHDLAAIDAPMREQISRSFIAGPERKSMGLR